MAIPNYRIDDALLRAVERGEASELTAVVSTLRDHNTLSVLAGDGVDRTWKYLCASWRSSIEMHRPRAVKAFLDAKIPLSAGEVGFEPLEVLLAPVPSLEMTTMRDLGGGMGLLPVKPELAQGSPNLAILDMLLSAGAAITPKAKPGVWRAGSRVEIAVRHGYSIADLLAMKGRPSPDVLGDLLASANEQLATDLVQELGRLGWLNADWWTPQNGNVLHHLGSRWWRSGKVDSPNHARAVRLAVAAGAEPAATDRLGHTPLQQVETQISCGEISRIAGANRPTGADCLAQFAAALAPGVSIDHAQPDEFPAPAV